jgi:NitT/TauT family transport system substrate-binding protein
MRLTAAAAARPAASTRRSLRSGRSRAAMAGLGVALLAAGCGNGGGSAGGPVSGTVTIAAVPGVDNVPLFLAQHDGLFQAAGLNVDIKTYASVTAELADLRTGRVDIAAGDYGPFLYAESQAKTAGIKIVSDGYDATSGVLEVLTLPTSGINSPEGIGGQRIGTPDSANLPTAAGGPDSLATAATTSVLRSFGVNMATVRFDPMAESAEVAALKRHQVPAILVTEPYIFRAESQLGAVEVLDSCSGATANLPLSGYFAMSAWSQDHTTALADFRSALSQAQSNAAMSGPVQGVLHSYTGMTKLEAALVTVGTYPDSTDLDDLQRVSQLLSDQSVLSNPVAIAKQLAP